MLYSHRVKWGFVICVALAGVACKDHELSKLEAIRTEVCQCKTVACAEAALGKLPQKDIQSNRRTQGLAQEMLSCVAELYQSARPTLDPDAELTDP